ncbi:L-serine ammonia-lyase, iron-sulfur-dependent, subunit alpha [Anaerotignum propionicum]|nr:L-serine ammonia-lyase, iron-sulfur-dependent, subunit alpha [Anaerotignum propionicum]
MSKEEVYNKMGYIAQVMEESVYEGLNNPKPGQIINARAGRYLNDSKNQRLIPLGVMDTAIAWSMAVVEVNSRYGRIVAAPTGGACGVTPGAILGVAEHLCLSKEDRTKALLAAGIVGLFIAEHATFAAEICGCQAECGAASAMAAAGVVQLYVGTPKQCAAAASIALQNVLGMVCDSVADLVEVPCLGRNVLGTINAISCAIWQWPA